MFAQLSVIYTLPRLFPASFNLLIPYFATGTTERLHEEGQVKLDAFCTCFFLILRLGTVWQCVCCTVYTCLEFKLHYPGSNPPCACCDNTALRGWKFWSPSYFA